MLVHVYQIALRHTPEVRHHIMQWRENVRSHHSVPNGNFGTAWLCDLMQPEILNAAVVMNDSLNHDHFEI